MVTVPRVNLVSSFVVIVVKVVGAGAFAYIYIIMYMEGSGLNLSVVDANVRYFFNTAK